MKLLKLLRRIPLSDRWFWGSTLVYLLWSFIAGFLGTSAPSAAYYIGALLVGIVHCIWPAFHPAKTQITPKEIDHENRN